VNAEVRMGNTLSKLQRVIAGKPELRKRGFGEQCALTLRIPNKNKFMRPHAIADYKRLTVTSPLNLAVCVSIGVSADLRKGLFET
jgi:hypothetical protein